MSVPSGNDPDRATTNGPEAASSGRSLSSEAGPEPAGGPGLAPSPELAPQRVSAIGFVARTIPWLLACCGVAVVYLLLSSATYLAAGDAIVAAIRALQLAASDVALLRVLNLVVQVSVQLVGAVAFGLWWRYLRPRAFAPRRIRPLRQTARAHVERICGIVILGVALQLAISVALTLLVAVLPHAIEEYSEMMASSDTNEFSLLSVMVLSLGAPLLEEVMCRGVLLELALRAVCPTWRAGWRRIVDARSREAARARAVPRLRFWIANILQAGIFGMLHGDPVQVAYAFVLGLVLGAVFWQTGRLRYNIALHAAINFASFGVDFLWQFLAPLGLLLDIALLVGICVWAARLFLRGTEPFAGLLPAAGETGREC